MSDSEIHRRTPYVSEASLQDPRQQKHIQGVLGLEDESLNNAQPLPKPPGYGAGRVKKFRQAENNVSSTHEGANPVLPMQAQDTEQALPPNTPTETEVPGYPCLAQFMSSDDDFLVFRGFRQLSTRNLLVLQDELAELEGKLSATDLTDARLGNSRAIWNLHSRREDLNSERTALLHSIRTKLAEYQDALHRHSRTLALEKASKSIVDSVSNWVEGMKPTTEPESHFLDDRSDLVSLVGGQNEKELLERILEARLYNFFATKKESSSPNTTYYSAERIKAAARVAVTLLTAVLAVLPMPILAVLNSNSVRIPAIAVFSFIFASFFSLLTNSRTYELFVAMATYAAFLSVFISLH